MVNSINSFSVSFWLSEASPSWQWSRQQCRPPRYQPAPDPWPQTLEQHWSQQPEHDMWGARCRVTVITWTLMVLMPSPRSFWPMLRPATWQPIRISLCWPIRGGHLPDQQHWSSSWHWGSHDELEHCTRLVSHQRIFTWFINILWVELLNTTSPTALCCSCAFWWRHREDLWKVFRWIIYLELFHLE